MSRRLLNAVSACIFLIPFTLVYSADSQPSDEAKSALRSYVRTSKLEKAVNYLKVARDAGADAEALKSAGKARYKRKLATLKDSYQALEMPVDPFLKMKPDSLFLKEMKEWHDTAKSTMAYIFDDSTYAVPAKARTGWVPGKDIQPNQAIVEARVEETVELWNKMIARFGRHARLRLKNQRDPGGGGFARKLKSSSPDDLKMVQIPILEYTFTDPASGLDGLSRKAGNTYPSFKEAMTMLQKEIGLAKSTGYAPDKLKLKALPIAVAALYSGNIADAMSYRPTQGTDEGRVFAMYVSLYLYMKSLDQPKFMSKGAFSALKTNNLYRLSLGLQPMLPNEKLQRAADDHSIYQKKHGMSHTQHHKDMQTPKLRAGKAGYKGGVTENCYSGSIDQAVWTWRTDAGHHRNLIQARAKVVGFSDKGLPTKNCGYVCEDKLLAPLFTISY